MNLNQIQEIMKHIIKISGLLIALFILTTSTSFAQSGDINIGAGLIFGTEIEQPGIKADGYYTINEEFRAGVDIGYFFPDNFPGGDINWFEFNLNGNYIFASEDELSAYALSGLNFSSLKIDFDNNGSSSNTEIGLNIGAGGEYALDFGALFAELKYVISDADQLVVGAGVRFKVN